MTDKDKIVVDRPTATTGIAAIRAQQTKITDAGSAGAGLFDKVTAALGIAVPGQATVEAPTGGADTIRQQAAALSKRAGSIATTLESWMNTEVGVQGDGATAVTQADGGSGSKPVEPAKPTPTVKPYTTSGGTTGGVSPYPAVK
ncbi:hypothetical protein A5666_00030 [Mycolicibacterium fortuitum]|uniref:hypothetical protein n=1 Tax=Mycolicibacterium fortuitum TaxID=1766 RepID=UPI0007EB55A8|nr:hypothetical protein [Mycolicibacterium fortuitum]OBA92966.1 hypothetical protein A5665_10670 [Mycolicibacterium fortuitum]OBI66915.1 hypothetical protein A5666_00030 [Mycolicibacterium fortuitum]